MVWVGSDWAGLLPALEYQMGYLFRMRQLWFENFLVAYVSFLSLFDSWVLGGLTT